ncbi:MAG: TSUP family transporter [Candidatus Omnitrophica bacterium]|nr:TSUP family transporter [Candidatus Omnitrophota bacterium]MBU1925364.1 TSUP family transporter [Candidatus Omnitrophota bacterium]MBU2063588.1 TSUP family transporter [Candidatus Omnitrophota bacterium]
MPFIYIVVGVLAGVLGGFFGIGGAIVIVPVLVLMFDFTQHQAQGTTLAALVPPIGLLAAWRYYTQGNVNIHVAAFIALGFFLGGYLGALLVGKVPDIVLKKMFGVLLFVISLRLIIFK